jgi:hypothetical protein
MTQVAEGPTGGMQATWLSVYDSLRAIPAEQRRVPLGERAL